MCKLGQEGKSKEWRNGLEELFKEAKIEFMFYYHEPLAVVFV